MSNISSNGVGGYTLLGKGAELAVHEASWKEEGKHSSLLDCTYINA